MYKVLVFITIIIFIYFSFYYLFIIGSSIVSGYLLVFISIGILYYFSISSTCIRSSIY